MCSQVAFIWIITHRVSFPDVKVRTTFHNVVNSITPQSLKTTFHLNGPTLGFYSQTWNLELSLPGLNKQYHMNLLLNIEQSNTWV